MSSKKLDVQKLGVVFQARPDILNGIKEAADSPSRVVLFNNIASFVDDQLASADSLEPALKRRRIDDKQAANGNASESTNGASSKTSDILDAAAGEQVLLEIKDISLSVPQRKKFDLCFTKSFLYARAPGTSGPVQGIVYAWEQIDHVFYLPVPEKQQQQHNYVLFPRGSCLPVSPKTSSAENNGSSPTAASLSPSEPLVFTVGAAAPKTGGVAGPQSGKASAVSDNYSTLFHWALSTSLQAAGSTLVKIVAADPKLFHSAARQSYRPGEKAVHVKAFRGSKDGYLFFLPTGILWGFKKPLMFLPLDRIAAVSYTNVLQRTFNISVELELDGGATEEVEFGMLDQEDYSGIDENYVKRHRLQDRSMAEQRKAKRELAENAKKGGAEAGAGTGTGADAEGGEVMDVDGGMTELEKAHQLAEQQIQDEEDEDEEDYDPGSEGDSEGEGETSEEEEDEEEGEEGEGHAEASDDGEEAEEGDD